MLKDREQRKEEKDEDNDSTNDDSIDVESNEVITAENLTTPAAEVVKIVDGQEVVVTDMDESLKIQNETRNMLKNATSGDGVVSNVTEISNVTNVIVPPVMPVKENFPRTKQGRRNFRNAYKRYVIEMKEYKKTQQNLVKPTDKNKNGLTALNTTDGLTSNNVSSSKTIVLQRQIVRVNTPVQV